MKNRQSIAALFVLLSAGLTTPAVAKNSTVLPYGVPEVWSTGVRFLRIDRGCTIKEKDAESGYILFELMDGPRKYQGSLELIKTTDSDGRDATRTVFTLPDLPHHMEVTLSDKLAVKVKDDHGSPAAAKKPPAPAPEKKPVEGNEPPKPPSKDPQQSQGFTPQP